MTAHQTTSLFDHLVGQGEHPVGNRVALFLLLSVAAASAGPRTFKDCETCPEMVEIPAGRFIMGVPRGEEERLDWDGANAHRNRKSEPMTEVEIKRFALGKFELTHGQFAEFVEDTKYEMPDYNGCWNPYGRPAVKGADERRNTGRNELIPDASWKNPTYPQDDNHPVVCVGWADITAYLAWLSKKTGHDYRLPSESEWEYAARAGTITARPWGNDDPAEMCKYGNFSDQSRISVGIDNAPDMMFPCSDGYAFTAPVGSFPANAFGLHDMMGNVWEVTADCMFLNLDGLPRDGSPRGEEGCKIKGRPARGAAFDVFTYWTRVGYRSQYDIDGNPRYSYEGFRVARSLN